MTEPPRLLTVAEAAAVLRVHPDTLRSWAKSGRIASVRHGRSYRFETTALTCAKEEKCRSTNVKVRRSGGRTSVSLDTPDFESQLAQLIGEKRKASTTGFGRSSGQSRESRETLAA